MLDVLLNTQTTKHCNLRTILTNFLAQPHTFEMAEFKEVVNPIKQKKTVVLLKFIQKSSSILQFLIRRGEIFVNFL